MPFKNIQLSGRRSPSIENGINNFGRKTRIYGLVPLRSQTHRPIVLRVKDCFPSLGQKALLVEISQGEPSRRDTRSANHIRADQNGATNIK